MIPKIVHESWYEPLAHLWSDPRLIQIKDQLRYFKFSPEANNIFRAFSLPMDRVRVVMVPLSPYNQVLADGTLYATGLAMGTPNVDTETLRAIRLALWNDYRDITSEDLNLSLEHWHEQGVILLNKSLTVPQYGKADEHIYPKDYGKFIWPGWEWFTSGVIEAIDKHCNSVVFAFLGAEAAKYGRFVSGHNWIEYAPHPVARYYYQRANPGKKIPENIDFTTCRLFGRIDDNTYLTDETKIKWF